MPPRRGALPARLLGLDVLAGFSTGGVADGPATFDVTAPVQAWVNGAPNHGWALLPLGANGWDFSTRGGATPPQLTITFLPPSG